MLKRSFNIDTLFINYENSVYTLKKNGNKLSDPRAKAK